MRTLLLILIITITLHAQTAKNKTILTDILLKKGSDNGIEMVFVKGGTFKMGDTFGNGDDDEKPVHQITVDDFYIGKYEVTQKLYREIMGENPSIFKGDDLPVEKVSWYDAVKFCNKLSEKAGLEKCYTIDGENVSCDFSKNGFRLPTEAEWEYAARGGAKSKGYEFSGSNDVDEVAWYKENSSDRTHPVGTKKANELGIYDMSGNVYEWCWDWYDSDYYKKSPEYNPRGPEGGSYRVERGGSWVTRTRYVRCASRYKGLPSYRGYFLGFRIVKKP